jgi:nicotinamide mononucleotide transporter
MLITLTHNLVSTSQLALLEWSAVFCNLAFVVLVMRQKIIAWPIGIIGSLLSVFYFLSAHINMPNEAFLYSSYVFMGIYGWVVWSKNSKAQIIEYTISNHIFFLVAGFILWAMFAYFSKIVGGSVPIADAFTTSFGLVATFLEAKRVLRSWWYWVVLNAFSIGLYLFKDSHIYAVQMVVFTALSVVGYFAWKKDFDNLKEPQENFHFKRK